MTYPINKVKISLKYYAVVIYWTKKGNINPVTKKSYVSMNQEIVISNPSLKDCIQIKYISSVQETSLKSKDLTITIKNEVTRIIALLEDHVHRKRKLNE